MSQSLVQIYLHIVFSTKYRQAFLTEEAFRLSMHAFLGGTCRNLEAPAIAVGGYIDHVHLLCRFPKSLTVQDFLEELKVESSKWAKKQPFPGLESFYWQAGYGAFSVSPGHVDRLIAYIANQMEHHANTEPFQPEFRRLLRRYRVEFDERYVWD